MQDGKIEQVGKGGRDSGTRVSTLSLRRRVSTRLAWLEVRHRDFACAIGMDPAVFSRMLRMQSLKRSALDRIAVGLGLSSDALLDEGNREVLLLDHPAFSPGIVEDRPLDALRRWWETEGTPWMSP